MSVRNTADSYTARPGGTKKYAFSTNIPVPILAVFALGCYTNLPIIIGEFSFPMASALPGFFLLLPYLWRRFFSTQFHSLMYFLLLPLCFSVFAPSLSELFGARLVGMGQLFYSLVLGFTAYSAVTCYPREKMSRIFLWLVVCLVILCIIERYTSLKSVVQSYAELYGGEGITDSVLTRDEGLGGYRPKLFTSETSYVAMALSYGISCYVWSSTNSQKYMVGLVLLAASFLVLRSPTVLGCILPLAASFVEEIRVDKKSRAAAAWLVPSMLVVTILGGLIVGDRIADSISTRLEGARSGQDYSVTYRTYGSLAAGIASANEYPLFGVGLAGHILAKDLIIRTELSFGVPSKAIEREWRMSLNNAPANSLVVFGYLGSLVIWIFAIRGIRTLSLRVSPTLMAMIFILCISDGAIYSPRFVTYLFLFAAVARQVHLSRTRLISVRKTPYDRITK